jgi:hypothetical protein
MSSTWDVLAREREVAGPKWRRVAVSSNTDILLTLLSARITDRFHGAEADFRDQDWLKLTIYGPEAVPDRGRGAWSGWDACLGNPGFPS